MRLLVLCTGESGGREALGRVEVRRAPTAGSTGGRARTARGQKVSVSGLGRAVRTGRVPMRTRRGYLPHDGQC